MASALGKAIGFLMLPFYAHMLRNTGYGVIGMMEAGLMLLMSLFCYGISGSITRFYHEEEGKGKSAIVSTGLILIWFIGGGLTLTLAAFSSYISTALFGNPEYALHVSIALASFLFELTGTNATTLMVIEQRSLLFSAISTLRLLLGLSMNILFIIVLRLDVLGYFLSSLTCSLFFSLVTHLFVLRQTGLHFDLSMARRLILFELPFVPSNLLTVASTQVERVFVRYFINLEGVGILEMGYKFPALLQILIAEPFFRSWHTKRTEIAHQDGAAFAIGRMFTYFLFIICFGGLLLSVSVKHLIRILTPEEFWFSYRIAKIEIVTIILSSCYYHLFFGLYYTKRTATLSIIKGVCAAIKVPLSVVMVYFFGLYGAALSGAFVAAFQMAWTARQSQLVYPIPIEYKKIMPIVLLAVFLEWVLASADFGHITATLYPYWHLLCSDFIPLLSYFNMSYYISRIVSYLDPRFHDIIQVIIKTAIALGYSLLSFIIFDHLRYRMTKYFTRINLRRCVFFHRQSSKY